MAKTILFVGRDLGHSEAASFGEEHGIVAEATVSTALRGYCTFTLAAGIFDVAGGQGEGHDADEASSAGLVRDAVKVA